MISWLPWLLDHALSGVAGAIGYILAENFEQLRKKRPASSSSSGQHEDEGALPSSPSQGPYRTSDASNDPADAEAHAEMKESDWRYSPREVCPRCGAEYIRNLGRAPAGGCHDYKMMSGAAIRCTGGKSHIHFECEQCHVDWAEIPPEEYETDDIHS